MNLLRHIILLGSLFLAIASTMNAGQVQLPASLPNDTLVKKDTIPLNDLKKGFKNLFLSTASGAGISSQLNPQAISFVQDYMARHSKGLKKMKDWGRPYFDMMDAVLTQYGLPKELKYLAVIESHLEASAVSWAGAVGPWQFMPATARRYGLIVNRQYDERTDYVKSTHAASKMLKDLFRIYGDWLLVIAAYNGGPGNVNAAIRRSGSRDFWTLQYRLPNESKDHVKKFISTHYIMEGEGGITTLTKMEVNEARINNGVLTPEELSNSRILTVGSRYNSSVIAQHINMSITDFNRYNPVFQSAASANGSYEMRLPNDKMDIFIAKKYEILEQSMQLLLQKATNR